MSHFSYIHGNANILMKTPAHRLGLLIWLTSPCSVRPSVRQTGAPMFELASLWVSFSNIIQLWITEFKKSAMHQAIFTVDLERFTLAIFIA